MNRAATKGVQVLECIMENQKWTHHLSTEDKHPAHIPNILIVDDDVDSAIAVQSIFRHYGCNVEFALDAFEARRQISSGKADIIILDWMLDHQTTADVVLGSAVRRMSKFRKGGRAAHLHRPKIITFSGRLDSEVDLPLSPFYEHFAHWQKPLQYPELARRALSLLTTVGF